jgi:hypothetical protein
VERKLDDVVEAPLRSLFDVITTVCDQDLEKTKDGVRIREGVANTTASGESL